MLLHLALFCSAVWLLPSQAGSHSPREHSAEAEISSPPEKEEEEEEEEAVLPCKDTVGSLKDRAGESGCANYGWDPKVLCGKYDTADFVASKECCACGGGQRGDPGEPEEPSEGALAAEGGRGGGGGPWLGGFGHADPEEGRSEHAVAQEEEEAPHGGARAHEGGAPHGHHKPSRLSTALSLELLGFVAWVMSLFYNVNSRDRDIRKATWDVLNNMISIFCAVLMFQAVKDVFVNFFGEKRGKADDPVDTFTRQVATARWLILLVAGEILLWLAQKNKRRMQVLGVLGGHILGFCAIEALGTCMELDEVQRSFWLALLALFVCYIFFFVVFLPMHFLRRHYGHHPMHEDWKQTTEETENEAACLSLGKLNSMLIRFYVTGEMPALHGPPSRTPNLADCLKLFAMTGLCGLLVVLLGILRKKAHEKGLDKAFPWQERAHVIAVDTMSMTAGWCGLFWGQWQFRWLTGGVIFGQQDPMTEWMLLSMIFDAGVFISIRVLDFAADNSQDDDVEYGLRALLRTFGLLMALSWEAVFALAVEGIGENFPHPTRTLVDVAFTFGLCAVVLPAWWRFILPKSVAEEPDFVIDWFPIEDVGSKDHPLGRVPSKVVVQARPITGRSCVAALCCGDEPPSDEHAVANSCGVLYTYDEAAVRVWTVDGSGSAFAGGRRVCLADGIWTMDRHGAVTTDSTYVDRERHRITLADGVWGLEWSSASLLEGRRTTVDAPGIEVRILVWGSRARSSRASSRDLTTTDTEEDEEEEEDEEDDEDDNEQEADDIKK